MDKKHVLIVEDDPGWRKPIRKEFEKSKNHEFIVDEVGSVEGALQKVAVREYDVVTVDIDFPTGETDGLEFMKSVLMQESDNSVKIVLTAYDSIRDCVAAMRMGAWDFISKKDPVEAIRSLVASAVSRLHALAAVATLEKHLMDDWLPKNHDSLAKRHAGQYIVIMNDKVVASAPQKSKLMAQFAMASRKPPRGLPYVMFIDENRSSRPRRK